jgi:hypothetical protein
MIRLARGPGSKVEKSRIFMPERGSCVMKDPFLFLEI